MRETLGTILLLLALSACPAVLLLNARQSRGLRRWPPYTPRRLSRGQLAFIATGGRLRAAGGIALALALLIGAMTAYGRLTLPQAAGTFLTAEAVLLLFVLVLLQSSLVPLRALWRPGLAPSDALLFTPYDGAWQHSDDRWFIRVGGGDSCALYAPALDLTVPVQPTVLLTFEGSGGLPAADMPPALRFATRSGRPLVVKIRPDGALAEWVRAHGGGWDL